jgi:integrase
MRSKRYQTGGVKKQRGRWIGMWWVDGRRKSRVLGLINSMSKSQARAAVNFIMTADIAERSERPISQFGDFVEQIYFPYYRRKWKESTRGTTMNRVSLHLVTALGEHELSAFRRDELQDVLDRKVECGLSFSVVEHLRWDLKQIFDMAVAEGYIERNPALLLFTPRQAKRAVRHVMTTEDVQTCIRVLAERERLIVKLAILAGMRPGEIFALRWERMTQTHAEIRQRVYRGIVDTPKTVQSERNAALSEDLLSEIEAWRQKTVGPWVFPSERLTPLAKENVWRRHIQPKLETVGLGWVNFQVMRRTHATLMNGLGVAGKLVADQLGHTLDVNQNVYTQSPVGVRQVAVNQLEKSLAAA